MYSRLRLINFKSHRDSTLELSPLTALVGPNNSGKTSVLRALEVFEQLLRAPTIGHVCVGRLAPALLARYGTNEYSIDAHTQETTVLFTGISPHRHGSWWLDNKRIEGSPTRGLYNHIAAQSFAPAGYFKFSATALARPSYSPEEHPVLGQDGYGLATLIDYLKGYAPEQFEQLNDAIHEVIPSVQRVRTGRQKLDLEIPVNQAQKQYFNYPIAPVSVIGNALILDMVGAPNLPAHAVSEGTLLVLGILTLMLSPNGPEVLLLDDIGQGLHPYAQQKLIPALRRVLDLNPKLQIIFTTHSPNIIDEMKPHEVQVVAADSEGVSHVRCLSEHPNVERALEVLTTGEFLGAEGESWVIEADPHSGGSDAADGGVG